MTDKNPSTRQDYTRSNAEMAAQWKIDVNRDPYDIPLAELDPGHDDLFAANKMLPYFERLRAEDPVHLSEGGPYGRYWSITKYEDIMAVDTNHKVFSSDIRNGGIRLGGQRLESEPDPLTHLPMFIMEDQPKHDEQRKAVQPMFQPQNLMDLEPLIRERAGIILDELPRGKEINWVREVSVELTGRTLATLFDVPQEDRHKLI
ncbi:MAG TPA: cytochrome P450, partial [Parvibaculum sp.]